MGSLGTLCKTRGKIRESKRIKLVVTMCTPLVLNVYNVLLLGVVTSVLICKLKISTPYQGSETSLHSVFMQ